MKLYQYTIYRQDGTIEALAPCPKKKFTGEDGLYALLKCQTIEIIPNDYCKGIQPRATFFGDEEGRFNAENHRNPHFTVLYDDNGAAWDVVGDIISEAVAK